MLTTQEIRKVWAITEYARGIRELRDSEQKQIYDVLKRKFETGAEE